MSRRALLAAAGSAVLIGPTRAMGAPDGPVADRNIPMAYSESTLLDARQSGGVSPDGIPSIDRPQFARASAAPTQLDDDDPVFGAILDGEAKAYPQYILVFHEIVNDQLGGSPIALTYCPLTGTAQGFYRGPLQFGVSGQLINSNLVMFDRGGDTLWPQIIAAGIDGSYSGHFLEEFRVIWTTWGKWKAAHPDTTVLTEDTGAIRDYGGDPYGSYNPRGGYYENANVWFPLLRQDERLHPKQMVLGTRTEDSAIAAQKRLIREERVLTRELNDVQYVVVYDEDLDTGWWYRSEESVDVQATEGGYMVDDETTHAADSLPLEHALTMDAMWFAWAAYYPDTEVIFQETTPEPEEQEEEDPVEDDSADEDEEVSDDAPVEAVDDDDSPDTPPEASEDDPLPGFGMIAGAGGIAAALAAWRWRKRLADEEQ